MHPHLLKDASEMLVYSGFEDFFTNDSTIHKITQEAEFKKWLDNTDLDAAALTHMLKTELWQQIKLSISEKTDKLNPNKYFKNIDGVYFEYYYQRDELKLISFNIQPVSSFALISCIVEMEAIAVIYPREYYWQKEKLNFSFIIKISFNLDMHKKISLNQIENVTIMPRQVSESKS
ncbi:hypothetical protein QWZ08_08335 [Ferruginibacter paludis]|uniref:hypothetical protein n=1 Tax=Ferruginibacter paludis TaxID=1310417 RepID=UPI0025B3DFEC|nr:hypothetical protein [Ferruginibacter paludis]MDN3655630.1 hypothetical protein [Ferruginibacter paludis]